MKGDKRTVAAVPGPAPDRGSVRPLGWKGIECRDPHTISQAHLLEQHARNFRSRSSDARATLESAGALFRASSRPSDMPTAGSRMRGIAMLERARSGGGIPTRLTP